MQEIIKNLIESSQTVIFQFQSNRLLSEKLPKRQNLQQAYYQVLEKVFNFFLQFNQNFSSTISFFLLFQLIKCSILRGWRGWIISHIFFFFLFSICDFNLFPQLEVCPPRGFFISFSLFAHFLEANWQNHPHQNDRE